MLTVFYIDDTTRTRGHLPKIIKHNLSTLLVNSVIIVSMSYDTIKRLRLRYSGCYLRNLLETME